LFAADDGIGGRVVGAAGHPHVCRQQGRERTDSALDPLEPDAVAASHANDRARHGPGGIARGPDQIAGERDGVIHAPDRAGWGVMSASSQASFERHRERRLVTMTPDTVCYRLAR
jgi:hypothetical protein